MKPLSSTDFSVYDKAKLYCLSKSTSKTKVYLNGFFNPSEVNALIRYGVLVKDIRPSAVDYYRIRDDFFE
jgi:hypothetical protein